MTCRRECRHVSADRRFHVHEGYQDGISYHWVVDSQANPPDWIARFPYGAEGLSNAKYFADCKAEIAVRQSKERG